MQSNASDAGSLYQSEWWQRLAAISENNRELVDAGSEQQRPLARSQSSFTAQIRTWINRMTGDDSAHAGEVHFGLNVMSRT